MMDFFSNPMVIAALVFVTCLAIGHFLFAKDTQIEDRRKNAIRIANELRSEGLEYVPEMLETYAVGDYSGMMDKATRWLDYLRDDESRAAFFGKFRRRQLELNMSRPAQRAEIIAVVEQYRAIEDAENAKKVQELQAKGLIPPSAITSVPAPKA